MLETKFQLHSFSFIFIFQDKNCLIGKQIKVLASVAQIHSAKEGCRFFDYDNLCKFEAKIEKISLVIFITTGFLKRKYKPDLTGMSL